MVGAAQGPGGRLRGGGDVKYSCWGPKFPPSNVLTENVTRQYQSRPNPAKNATSQKRTFQDCTFGPQNHYFYSVFSQSGRGPKTCVFGRLRFLQGCYEKISAERILGSWGV